MRLMKLLLITALLSLIAACSGDQTAGTVDSSETGVLAIYYPNGEPASGVKVSLYDINEKENRPVAEMTTNEKGEYDFSALNENIPDGKYNIIAMTAESGIYRDSVPYKNDTTAGSKDTLRDLGIISGYVKVQVNHSPQTVTIHILGTGVNNSAKLNVSKEGFFTFPELAPGTYNVEFLSTEEDYTPTYQSIEVIENIHDTLDEPIELIYTGIPIVQGMALSYDTIKGEVSFNWNASDYEFIQRYLVERKGKSDIEWDTIATIDVNGESHDSSFVDLPFENAEEAESLTLQYRVRIEDKQGIPGKPFEYVEITVPNPRSVQTTISTKTNGTTFSINDTVHLKATLINPTKEIRSVRWFNEEFNLDTISNHSEIEVFSEVKIALTTTGTKEFRISTIDENGIETEQMISVEVVSDAPRIIHFSDSIKFSGDSLYVYAEDTYGDIVKYEWKTNDAEGFISTGDSPHFPLFSDSLFINKPVSVRVTDNDGESTTKEILVTYKPKWDMFNIMEPSAPTKLFSIDNFIFSFGYDEEIYLSTNTQNWESTGSKVPFHVNNADLQVVRFNDHFWALSSTSSKAELWKSSDLISWDKIEETNSVSIAPMLFIFQNQLYCNLKSGTINEFYASTNGNEWVLSPGYLAPSKADFLAVTCDESNIIVFLNHNGKIKTKVYDEYMIESSSNILELSAENFSYHSLDQWSIIRSENFLYYSDKLFTTPPIIFSNIEKIDENNSNSAIIHKSRFYLFSESGLIFTNR